MSWIDALRQAYGNPRRVDDLSIPSLAELEDIVAQARPVPISHAVAAARLDAAGVDREEISTGLTLVLIPGKDNAEQMSGAIRKAMGASEIKFGSSNPAGRLFVVPGTVEIDLITGVVSGGAHVVVVVDWPPKDKRDDNIRKVDNDDARGQGNLALLRRVADRTVCVEASTALPIVRSVIRAVTGDDVGNLDIPSIDEMYLPLAIRHGDSGEDAVARMHVIAARAKSARDADKGDPILDLLAGVTEPVAVASETTRQDPKLSELSGFGPAREWGLRLAEDLRAYRRGDLEWSDIDRGVMLVGAPGTGKSFFARALAAECEVELIAVGYQDWAGDANKSGDSTAGSMNKSFKEWRKKAQSAPIIAFIDELDSFGKRGSNGHNESWFQTQINSLLQFLDGAIPRDGIVVLGATNYLDRIDPAMLRPGRLERTVTIPLPSLDEMQGIVRHHLGLDDRAAAVAVRGRSPAQVAMDCREARRLARRGRRRPTAVDLREVVAAARPKRTESEEWMIAVHEAGHAVHASVSSHSSVRHVDLDDPHAMTDNLLFSEEAIVADLVTTLCGRAAEEIILGVAGTGAISDLEGATARARVLETKLGYGASGLLVVPDQDVRWSPMLTAAVTKRLDDAYETARAFVRSHRGSIERVARALVERRFLDGAEVEEVMRAVQIFRIPRPEVIPTDEEMNLPWRGRRRWVA